MSAPNEPFVLDLAENPHPRMLEGARQRRSAAQAIPERGWVFAKSPEAAQIRGEWFGYLAAMADATGCDPADLEAWMDRQ